MPFKILETPSLLIDLGSLWVMEFPCIPGWKAILSLLEVFIFPYFLAYIKEQRNYFRWVEF